VVFDMDRTMVAQHSRGALVEAKLPAFQKSLSEVVIKLIPFLIRRGFKVGVATLSDDLYTELLEQQSNNSDRVPQKYISGRLLVEKILSTFLSTSQWNAIEPYVITLNPGLYHSTFDTEENEDYLKKFFVKKLKDLGVPHPSDSGPRDKKEQLLKDCYSYPTEPYKIHHLRILRVLTGCEYNEMILIDDKAENVDKAIEMGSGGLLVEGKEALEWADLSTYVLLQNTGSEASSYSSDSQMFVSTTPSAMKTDRFGFGTRGSGVNLDTDYCELPSNIRGNSSSSSSHSSNGSPSSSAGTGSINSHSGQHTQNSSTGRQLTSPKPSGSTEGEDPSGCQPCTVCNKTATKRCSRCHGAYYCSTECQRRDWSSHKLHCFSPTVSERVD